MKTFGGYTFDSIWRQLILTTERYEKSTAQAAAFMSETGTNFCCCFTSFNSECIYFKLAEKNNFQLTVGKSCLL